MDKDRTSPETEIERNELNFAWALNEVLCEVIEGGATESRLIASKVTVHPKMQQWFRKSDLSQTPTEATEDDIAAVIVAAQTSNSSICAAALLQKFKITSRWLGASPDTSTDRTCND